MKVAIIGAGASGLASARHVIGSGFGCTIFEMGSELGGTWVYTDEVGTDKYGYPVYSAMYKGLRTNLPKEIMGYPDFPIPERNKSYLTQPEILQFLNLYADYFKIRPHVNFNTMVSSVRPLDGNKWLVTAVNKITKETSCETFDALMICNGHYNEPVVPQLAGDEKFRGKIEHSHHYRSPEPYKGQRVLIIGAGPSGLDLTMHICATAKYVVLSHRLKEPIATKYPANVSIKPDVRRINNHDQVEFVDGSCCCFDTILFCTGYKYDFPFLHASCGVTVDDNHIQPLYKHMIHIDRPTMCFIGIPFEVCTFHMFDLQARYFCKYVDGSMMLPSKEAMRMHNEEDMRKRWAKGYTKRQAHLMGPDQQAYYDDLAADAKTLSIAPVYVKLRNVSIKRLHEDLANFRNDQYKIVDLENYIRVQ